MTNDNLPLIIVCTVLIGILFLFLGKVFALFAIVAFLTAAGLGTYWWFIRHE